MKLYVAGRYNASNVIDSLRNIQRGIKYSAKLLKEGHEPFCPWLDHQFLFYEPSLTEADMKRYSMEWLKVCEEVHVLPGWESSAGTRAEILKAVELGIKVIYLKEKDLA